jgi:photosystem II stability/assembly factor-like uncharacterized protein
VSGCKGRVRISLDDGQSWVEPLHGLDQKVCLRPVGRLGSEAAVLVGQPGALVLVRPGTRALEVLPAPPMRQWRDASQQADGLLLVGDGGAIGRLFVDDQNKPRFEQLSIHPPAVVDLQVVGDRRAVQSSADGSVSWSTDGGRNWARTTPGAPAPKRIHFVDSNRGFALSGVHDLIGTTDGGRSWRSLGTWPDLALNDLTFLDAQRGWAVGGSGALVRTTDGGRSWTLDRVPEFEKDLFRVLFVQRNLGFVVGANQAVLRTRDGGKTWQMLVSGRANLYALEFVDARQGFVAGDEGLVMATTDGGDSWTPRPVPTSEPIRSLSFSDPLRGVAGGAGGMLFATRNAGRTWRRVELSTLANVNDVACFSKTGRCLIGGDHGLLLLGDPFRQVK